MANYARNSIIDILGCQEPPETLMYYPFLFQKTPQVPRNDGHDDSRL